MGLRIRTKPQLITVTAGFVVYSACEDLGADRMAMSTGLTSGGVCVAAIRDAVGLGAGLGPAIRPLVVLLFLAVAPTAAIAGLLRGLDGFARLVIACTTNITLLALIAMTMLAEGAWSPQHGLLAVAAITAACFAAQTPPVRRGTAALVASRRAAADRRTAVRTMVPADSAVAGDEGHAQPDADLDPGERTNRDEDVQTGEVPIIATTDAEDVTAEIPVIRLGEPADPSDGTAFGR
jgi:hypothetical protein